MSPMSSASGPAKIDLGHALQTASPLLEHFASFGFAAKGVVYIIIGGLAAMAPIGLRPHPTGTHGALTVLLRQPIGSLLLAVIALGFAAFGLWLILRAAFDPEGEGSDPRAIFIRIGWALGGLTHFGLVLVALEMIRGYRRPSDEVHARDWTARAMSYPLGRWIVLVVAAGILAYAVLQLYNGLTGRLDPKLSLQGKTKMWQRIIRGISRFGVAARGVVFGMLAVLLLRAVYDVNANEARGLGGTLRAI